MAYQFLSIANSIRFRKQDSNLQSFDNTLNQDAVFPNVLNRGYCQILRKETITIQARAEASKTVSISVRNQTLGSTANDSFSSVATYTDFDIYEYDLDLSAYADGTQLKITCTVDGVVFVSEPVLVKDYTDDELTEAGLVELKYSNYESDFGIDYSTGIINKMYVSGYFKDYEPGGESSIYDNLREKVKLRDIVYRILVLKTFEIPNYLAEQIQIAIGHSSLFVNDVEYTAEDNPSVSQLGNSNMVTVEVRLTQKDHSNLYW
jgi:hypothetical protein